MPSQNTTDDRLWNYKEILYNKLLKAIELKDYAISQNFNVSDDVIDKLAKARREYGNKEDNNFLENEKNIDIAIRELTNLTYPTTVNTLFKTETSEKSAESLRKFQTNLKTICLIGLVIAGLAYVISYIPPDIPKEITKDAKINFFSVNISIFWLNQAALIVLAVSLGVIGSLLYIAFNLMGILSEKAFDVDDIPSNYLRLFIGAVVGFVFYIGVPNASTNPTLKLLPFLAGFSTKLVVGIINQAIKAVELVLGLEDKAAQLAMRKSRQLAASQAPPSQG